MVKVNTIFLIFLQALAIVQTKALSLGHTQHTRSQSLSWKSCDINATLATECSTLAVPLDYTNTCSNETLSLEIIRSTAFYQPSRGSILFNFGGPGANGRADFAYYGPRLQAATGGHYDLVTFVPRGTGDTLLFSCYNSTLERTIASLTNPPLAGNSSDVALGTNWARSKVRADTCLYAQNKTGSLIGTAFVARDMMRIVDALNEDGMLRYWGVSYGTVLGATTAAMFPERIDKMILDGVVNPHEYYNTYETELYTDSDKVFSGFCTACITAGSNCTLARSQTADELCEKIYTFLNTLKYNPIPISVPGLSFVIDYTTVKSSIFSDLYSPVTWPSLATILDGLMTGDYTAVIDYITRLSSIPPSLDAEALPGIKCGDKIVRSPDIKGVLPDLQGRHERSRIGGDTADHVVMLCAQWGFAAKEQYMGDFQIKTKNPVLLIGNSFDPVTPLVSARNVSSGFDGSVVLQQDSYGHATLTQGSLCTAKTIMAYFENGTLPQAGTVCSVDAPVFSTDDGWDSVVEKLGFPV